MNTKKAAAILATFIVPLCLVASLDVGSAKPTPQLTIDPKSGAIGGIVSLSGSNFAKTPK